MISFKKTELINTKFIKSADDLIFATVTQTLNISTEQFSVTKRNEVFLGDPPY
jgi:hypothetical protein